MRIPLGVCTLGGSARLVQQTVWARVRPDDVRDRACSAPLVEVFVAVSHDVLGVAEKLDASRILLDLVDSTVELGCLAVGGEDVGPEEVADTPLARGFQRASRGTRASSCLGPYREHEADHDQAKVEALLRRASGLFRRRKLIPGHESSVIERGDALTPWRRRRSRSEAVVGRVISRQEHGRARSCQGAGSDRPKRGCRFHRRDSSLSMIPGAEEDGDARLE